MKRNPARIAAVFLFILFLFYGFKAYNDYGISWDEPIERESSLVTWKYLHPEDAALVTDSVNFNMVPELHDYHYRYYGTAAQLPLVLAESLTDFTMSLHDVYLTRHLYVFLLFFCAALCFYRLCQYLTKNDWLAFMGALFFILSPRILADSFYNIKDSLTLSLYLIASWRGVRFIEKPNIKNILLLSFFGALCTNARIVGAIILVCCFIAAFVKSAVDHTWKRQLGILTVTGALSLGFYILLSPVTWHDPVGEMINTVKTFSSYGGYEGTVPFLGQTYRPDGLPWFYLPLWICITTPLTILALAFAGIISRLYHMKNIFSENSVRADDSVRHSISTQGAARLFLFLTAAVPLLYALLLKPSMYNGWRHFYFIYPFIALSAVAGLRFLSRKLKNLSLPIMYRPARSGAESHTDEKSKSLKVHGHQLLLAAVFACLCVTGIWILSNHPYEYAYFNRLAREHVEDNFEKDYWAVSQRDQLIYLCGFVPDGQFSVWMNDGTQSCRYLLDDASQNRILVTDNAARADYLVDRHVGNPETSYFKLEHMYRPLHTIVVDGITLSTAYQRIYNQTLQSFLIQDQTNGTYTAGNIDWNYDFFKAPGISDDSAGYSGQTAEASGPFVTWTGQLAQAVPTDLIMAYPEEDGPLSPKDLRVEVSEDETHWIAADTVSGWDFHFSKMNLRFIRITYPDPTKCATGTSCQMPRNQGSARLEVCVYQKTTDEQTEIPSIIEGVSASVNPDQVILAVDGTELTGWSSQEPQKPGMEYRLSLRRNCSLSHITLSLGDSPWDRPADMEIWNSSDGINWKQLDVTTEDGENYYFPRTDCRYLKFALGPGCEGAEANWSIYEISLYGEAGPA